MKRCLLTFVFFVMVAGIAAQDQERKGYIGIMLGPSIPYGGYAATKNYDDGYAKTGLNINLLTFGYKIWNNLGVTGSWFGIANPLDQYGINGTAAHGAIIAGPLYSVPLSEKNNLDLRAMAGFVFATRQFEFSNTGRATGPGFGAGVMLRHDIAKSWCLMFNVETFNTHLDLQSDKDPRTALINLSFGVAYRLK